MLNPRIFRLSLPYGNLLSLMVFLICAFFETTLSAMVPDSLTSKGLPDDKNNESMINLILSFNNGKNCLDKVYESNEYKEAQKNNVGYSFAVQLTPAENGEINHGQKGEISHTGYTMEIGKRNINADPSKNQAEDFQQIFSDFHLTNIRLAANLSKYEVTVTCLH